jgi:hypothetical protein
MSQKDRLGALKYFILKVDPHKNMTFTPSESIDFNVIPTFHPVYLCKESDRCSERGTNGN